MRVRVYRILRVFRIFCKFLEGFSDKQKTIPPA